MAYRDVILATPGLVAYWELGEASGLPHDSKGANHMSTSSGTPTYGVAGVAGGTGIRFNGGDQFSAPDAPAFAWGNGPWSIEFWCRRVSLSGDQVLWFKGGQGDLYFEVGTNTLAFGNMSAIVARSSVAETDTTGFHHWVVTHAPGVSKIYRDGVDVTGYTDPAATTTTTASLFSLGYYAGVGYFFSGVLDEVAAYNVVLTPAQVALHFAAASGGALIRGAIIKIELYLSGAWTDITCQTTTAEWQWGAPEALGPLTECEGGTLRVSLWDPDREYDPDNPDSPLLGLLKVGLGMRVTVDGSPAWTGVLQTWGWDRASGIADLNGLDPIGMLSVRALPERFTMAPVSTTSAGQAQYLLDFVEWPVGKRYFPDGTSGVERGNHYVEGSVLDGLNRIRFAELGRLFPLRDGGIGWYDRDGPTPPASSVTINCGGVGLTDMWRVMGLGRVRNRVVVSGGYGVFGQVRPPDEYRSVTTSFEFLAFAYTAPAALPWDLWAQTILDALDPPPVLTMLGTIVPEGDEVADVVCAEFGDRWTVASAGDPDKVVQVLGQRVTLAPGTIEVDVVTEDIYVPVPTAHRMVGTGSGYITSSHTISYAQALAGAGTVTPTVPGGAAPQYIIGQTFGAGPIWQIMETFLWFDTSAIPIGATIVSAEFAAMFHPHWNGLTPPPAEWTHFDVQVRSGYAWRPTLAAADYRPGAGIAAGYPLRAKINTARAIKDSFATFEDAGSGLAGAIVKGGETQLFLVSSRTTVGTAPASTLVYEDLFVDFPRLRVKYVLP